MTNNRFSEEDLERLVLGNEPDDQELSRLAEALQNWQADFTRTPSDEQVAAFAAKAAEIARQNSMGAPARPSAAPTRSRLRALRYKLAASMAAVLMLSGMTGVAAASDEAAPGDTLYGIDRVLENIGIGAGGIQERFSEAAVLNDRGNASEALAHAAEAIAQAGADEADVEEALTGLDDAIAALNENIPGDEGEVRAKVAEMLGWMQTNGPDMLSDTEAEPGAFGREIANRARGISTENEAADAAEDAADAATDAATDAAKDTADAAKDAADRADGEADDEGEPGPPDGVPGGPPDNVPPSRP